MPRLPSVVSSFERWRTPDTATTLIIVYGQASLVTFNPEAVLGGDDNLKKEIRKSQSCYYNYYNMSLVKKTSSKNINDSRFRAQDLGHSPRFIAPSICNTSIYIYILPCYTTPLVLFVTEFYFKTLGTKIE